jgi:hypothetical protein
MLGPSLAGVLQAATASAGHACFPVGRAQHPRARTRRLRQTGRSYFYACARNADGKQVEAWLETIEGYAFTAQGGVLAVERILAESPVGRD